MRATERETSAEPPSRSSLGALATGVDRCNSGSARSAPRRGVRPRYRQTPFTLGTESRVRALNAARHRFARQHAHGANDGDSDVRRAAVQTLVARAITHQRGPLQRRERRLAATSHET